MNNIETMNSKELKAIGKELKISGWWSMKKDELIAKIRELQDETIEETSEETSVEETEIEETEKDVEEAAEESTEESDEEENEDEEESTEEDQPKDETPAPTPKRGQLIEWNGKAQNICKWGEELGISPNTLYGRLYKLGWSVEKAFTKGGKN